MFDRVDGLNFFGNFPPDSVESSDSRLLLTFLKLSYDFLTIKVDLNYCPVKFIVLPSGEGDSVVKYFNPPSLAQAFVVLKTLAPSMVIFKLTQCETYDSFIVTDFSWIILMKSIIDFVLLDDILS